MLRTLFVVSILSMFSQSTQAFELRFQGACSADPLFSVELAFEKDMNVGELSLQVLDDHQIPYQGTASGLNQIFETPVGLEAMEIISENEMMAYGWCFEIDGRIPEVLADKVPIKKTTKLITWFYAYAHYLNGEWISQCEKSHLRRSPVLCP